MPNNNIYSKNPEANKTLIYVEESSGNSVAVAGDSDGVVHTRLLDSYGSTTNLPLTSFKDLRVSNISAVVGYSMNYNINSQLVKTTTTGAATVTQSNSKAVLQTSATDAASSAKIETLRAMRYQPGIGAQIRFSAIFTTGVENSSQLIGIGDSSDGFFYGYNETNFGILRRQNGVDNWTYKNSWNGDKMDGTGGSGIILDETKGNIYSIQFQWLGFGVINYFIVNPNNGDYILVNTIRYPNANTEPSIYNPTLPIMALVTKTGGTSNIILQTSCSSGIIEGDIDYKSLVTQNAINNTKSIGVSSETNILTLRNNSTFASKVNRVRIRLEYLSIATDGNKSVTVRLRKNASLDGTPVYNNINTNTSVMSYDTAGTTVTGGVLVLSFSLAKVASNQLILSQLDMQLEPESTWTFSAISSNANEVDVSVSWIELW